MIKVKLRVFHRRAFFDLSVHLIAPQVQNDRAIHASLPDEFRPILRASRDEEQKRNEDSHLVSIVRASGVFEL